MGWFHDCFRYSVNRLAEWQNREISVALDWFNCTILSIWHQIGSQVTLAWQSNGIGVVMQQIGVDWQLSGFLLTAEWLLA